jgi:hypothetical protein
MKRIKQRVKKGSAPAPGAVNRALAIRTKVADETSRSAVFTPQSSARGRTERQPGRLRSPLEAGATVRRWVETLDRISGAQPSLRVALGHS